MRRYSCCARCGSRFEFRGFEHVSRLEVVRRYKCPSCGTSILDVTRTDREARRDNRLGL